MLGWFFLTSSIADLKAVFVQVLGTAAGVTFLLLVVWPYVASTTLGFDDVEDPFPEYFTLPARPNIEKKKCTVPRCCRKHCGLVIFLEIGNGLDGRGQY